MKRIITIQDISCIGKCSLTVALPIISAMGVETAIVPTAVLSTHTQFKGFTFTDLTEDMAPIKDHWKKEGFKFDAIYTGYLGSERQIKLVSDYFDTFKGENTVIVMDPAMADNGKLYAGFDEYFARKMGELCAKADIILPNISEACLMLGEKYPGEEADEETVKKLLLKLDGLGAKISVITGTTFADGTFGFTGYDHADGTFFKYGTPKVPLKSHGTGDVFASAFTGALMNSFNVYDSLKIAADYTCACIKNSYEDPEKVNYAVNFELEIPYLLKLINKK
ncbi:MAG: pyridoxamine kinase [Lachnospiraceae bacterium]|nr:pyridoxamine kinase [Lachnospiraceae bacterium]